jgi:glycosyl-4,4'-diaponeurosporenoate acyltransferase
VPLVELSAGWAVLVDCVVWTIVGVSTGYAAYRWPTGRLAYDGWATRLRAFEAGGRWYERRWRIRRWKDRLPEAGSVFGGGFSKRALRSHQTNHLDRFIIETRRAELTHWVVLAFAPLFLLWNPWWLALVMVAYALVANLPCIAVQRYNRGRLERVLTHRLRRNPTVR